MFSGIIRIFFIASLTLVLATACSKPKRPDGASDATGANPDQGIDANRDSALDPSGSDSGNISGLSTIFFEYDQARLTNEARRLLASNAEWIKANSRYTIQIEGHTDERGSVEYNLSLGERRAKSVKSYLEGLGVEGRRMTIISYGEEKPLQSGDSESAWSKNRRANFVPIQ